MIAKKKETAKKKKQQKKKKKTAKSEMPKKMILNSVLLQKIKQLNKRNKDYDPVLHLLTESQSFAKLDWFTIYFTVLSHSLFFFFLSWDCLPCRDYRRYFYTHKLTSKTQWDYPDADEISIEEARAAEGIREARIKERDGEISSTTRFGDRTRRAPDSSLSSMCHK